MSKYIVKRHRVMKVKDGRERVVDLDIIVESVLALYVNNKRIKTFLCIGKEQIFLGVGYLLHLGLIKNFDDIIKINFSDNTVKFFIKYFKADIINNSVRRKEAIANSYDDNFKMQVKMPDELKLLEKEKQNYGFLLNILRGYNKICLLYNNTMSTHGAAISTGGGEILFLCEDISRHNAIYKLFGKCFLERIDTKDMALIVSCRISSDIMLEIIKRKVTLIITIAAPTDMAILIAKKFGITLIGVNEKESSFLAYAGDLNMAINEIL